MVTVIFLVGPGWWLVFPGELWRVAEISWWALNGHCYLCPYGLRMVADISLWALDGHCHFLVGPGWLLIFLGRSWKVDGRRSKHCRCQNVND